ncbi:MAG: NfeD family protein [Gammaproteobacteria bacterium]|nr:NfeD family protein [Gammaproteobacteria bacterium]
MFDYMNAHIGTTWFILGCVLLALEALVLGLSTVVLLFAGLAAVLTGILMWVGLVPESWAAGIAVFTVSSAALAALLWKPFKKLQSESFQEEDKSSDFIGLEFKLDSTISRNQDGKYRYSGIEWRVELDNESQDSELVAGERVEVSGLSAGVLRVVKAQAAVG